MKVNKILVPEDWRDGIPLAAGPRRPPRKPPAKPSPFSSSVKPVPKKPAQPSQPPKRAGKK